MDNVFKLVDVSHPTWLLYVSLLVMAVYFRFSRLLSVRNFDLLLLLLVSTTLVVSASQKVPPAPGSTPPGEDAAVADQDSPADTLVDSLGDGDSPQSLEEDTKATTAAEPSEATAPAAEQSVLYRWSSFILLALSVMLICRLVLDEALTRRPRLEQNLNQAGLTFFCVPSFLILMSSVFVGPPTGSTVAAVKSGRALLHAQESGVVAASGDPAAAGATPTMIAAGAAGVAENLEKLTSNGVANSNGERDEAVVEKWVARILVVLAHTLVVLALLYIGRRHFSSMQLGVSMSCLYLLLPCTAYRVHEISHILPAAFLTWAVAMYRRPAVAGVLLGLACGTLFFAVFLLPVWAVFYGRKGSLRFGLSLAAVTAAVLTTYALTSADTDSFTNKLVTAANWSVFRIFDSSMTMSNSAIGQLFLRITLASVFFVMLTAMTVIPRKRNLENLLANSTALVVTAQLWYPEEVGSYVLWYLPLLLLVMFRPRLDRFVPPEIPDGRKAELLVDQNSVAKSGGTLPRVTLYS